MAMLVHTHRRHSLLHVLVCLNSVCCCAVNSTHRVDVIVHDAILLDVAVEPDIGRDVGVHVLAAREDTCWQRVRGSTRAMHCCSAMGGGVQAALEA